jgi:hypothetical protein
MLHRHNRTARSLIVIALLFAAAFSSPLFARASSPAGDAESLDGPSTAVLPSFAYLPLVQVAPPVPFVQKQPLPAWTAQWWLWMERLGSSPAYEFGDVDCSRGQTGNVWFLAGSFEEPNTEYSTRRCTIPADKSVMAPLYTAVWVNFPGENYTVAEKLKDLDETFSDTTPGSAFGKICDLISTIDGINVPHTRLQSSPFLLFDDPEAVQDGFWIAFDLAPGTHEIHIGGTLCAFGEPPATPPGAIRDRVDATYFVTVE